MYPFFFRSFVPVLNECKLCDMIWHLKDLRIKQVKTGCV
jgi:hypothetical protein